MTQTQSLQPSDAPHETLELLSERLFMAQREEHSHGTLTEGTTGCRGQHSSPGFCASMPSSSRRDASVCKIFLWLSYFTCRGVLRQKHSHRTTQWWAAPHHPPLGSPTGGKTASENIAPEELCLFHNHSCLEKQEERQVLVYGPQMLAWNTLSNLKPQ